VLRLHPNRPGIHYRIGRSLLGRFWQRQSQDDLLVAQKEFEQELQSDPANANAAYEVGELHRRAGQMDEAERYFEQALKYYPDFPEAQLALSAVLLEKHQPQQALEHAQRAAAVDPQNEVAWFRLAKVQRTLGNVAEQQKALAQYRHLHDIANQQKEVAPVFSPLEVTLRNKPCLRQGYDRHREACQLDDIGVQFCRGRWVEPRGLIDIVHMPAC
jgi:tetratricopeptide (TPR) repeat protein